MINNNGANPADLYQHWYGNSLGYDSFSKGGERLMIQHDNETLLIPALEAVLQLHQSYQNQIQELQAQNKNLEILNRSKDCKIAELECLVYAWSSEGEAICNSDW